MDQQSIIKKIIEHPLTDQESLDVEGMKSRILRQFRTKEQLAEFVAMSLLEVQRLNKSLEPLLRHQREVEIAYAALSRESDGKTVTVDQGLPTILYACAGNVGARLARKLAAISAENAVSYRNISKAEHAASEKAKQTAAKMAVEDQKILALYRDRNELHGLSGDAAATRLIHKYPELYEFSFRRIANLIRKEIKARKVK